MFSSSAKKQVEWDFHGFFFVIDQSINFLNRPFVFNILKCEMCLNDPVGNKTTLFISMQTLFPLVYMRLHLYISSN